MPIEINIGNMKLNNVDHAAVVSLGRTVQTNRNVKVKKTQGFGQQLADRVLRFAPVQAVRDDDPSDACRIKSARIGRT